MEKEKIGQMAAEYARNHIAQAFERAGFTDRKIATELALIAFADMADYVTVDASGMIQANSLDSLKRGRSRVVKKVKERRVIRATQGTREHPDGEQVLDSTYEFELHSKLEAMKIAIDILGLNAPAKQEAVEHIHGLAPELQEMFDAIYNSGGGDDKKRGENGD